MANSWITKLKLKLVASTLNSMSAEEIIGGVSAQLEQDQDKVARMAAGFVEAAYGTARSFMAKIDPSDVQAGMATASRLLIAGEKFLEENQEDLESLGVLAQKVGLTFFQECKAAEGKFEAVLADRMEDKYCPSCDKFLGSVDTLEWDNTSRESHIECGECGTKLHSPYVEAADEEAAA